MKSNFTKDMPYPGVWVEVSPQYTKEYSTTSMKSIGGPATSEGLLPHPQGEWNVVTYVEWLKLMSNPHPPKASTVDQPKPKTTNDIPVWDLVIADMVARDQLGRERYGTPLQAFNGRDALIDAYQEALDLVVYLRQVIRESECED